MADWTEERDRQWRDFRGGLRPMSSEEYTAAVNDIYAALVAALKRAETAEAARFDTSVALDEAGVPAFPLGTDLFLSARMRVRKLAEKRDAALARVAELEAANANLEQGVTGLFHRSERALERAEKAEARVATLEAVLAEPSEDVVNVLGGMIMQQIMAGVLPVDVARAILAALRARVEEGARG